MLNFQIFQNTHFFRPEKQKTLHLKLHEIIKEFNLSDCCFLGSCGVIVTYNIV